MTWTNPRLPRVVIADQIQQLDSKVQLSSDRLLVKMGAITPPFWMQTSLRCAYAFLPIKSAVCFPSPRTWAGRLTCSGQQNVAGVTLWEFQNLGFKGFCSSHPQSLGTIAWSFPCKEVWSGLLEEERPHGREHRLPANSQNQWPDNINEVLRLSSLI